MDFYVPTEHNLMHTGWCKTSLCVLPGIEVTTDKGHMNLFGITEMPEKILEIVKHNGEEIIDTYMDQTIHKQNKRMDSQYQSSVSDHLEVAVSKYRPAGYQLYGDHQ